MTKISNSQISDFQSCELRFFFAQVKKLRPINLPEPMERGLAGHLLFQKALEGMLLGKTLEECYSIVGESLPLIDAKYWSVSRNVISFLGYIHDKGWVPVSVEERLSYTLPDGNEFVFTPDAIFKETKGVRAGQYVMVDWKFAAYQWSDREVLVFQQLPKYVYYWNLLKPHMRVTHAEVINLLTGNPKAFPYIKKPIDLSVAKLQKFANENERMVTKVAAAKAQFQVNDDIDEPIRSVNSYSCKMCFFAEDICPRSAQGKSIEKYIQINYIANTYFDDYEKMEKKKLSNSDTLTFDEYENSYAINVIRFLGTLPTTTARLVAVQQFIQRDGPIKDGSVLETYVRELANADRQH